MKTESKTGWGGARRNAGRPQSDKEKQKITLEIELWRAEKFRAIAKELGVSQPRVFSDWIDSHKS